MEFTLSHSSSLRISAIASQCKFTSRQTKTPIKPTCKSSHLLLKCSKNFPSFGLHSQRIDSKHASKRHYRCNSIWVSSSQTGAAGSDPILNKVSAFRDACWRFLRPHTIRGTTLGSVALVARALIENSNLIKWSVVLKAFSGLVALLCGNGYIVGINQIYDIGIDKYVVKLFNFFHNPHLPNCVACNTTHTQNFWNDTQNLTSTIISGQGPALSKTTPAISLFTLACNFINENFVNQELKNRLTWSHININSPNLILLINRILPYWNTLSGITKKLFSIKIPNFLKLCSYKTTNLKKKLLNHKRCVKILLGLLIFLSFWTFYLFFPFNFIRPNSPNDVCVYIYIF
ncbi:hypothetical protein ACOSP7_027202 [Xanthoceras sorbifolium]